MCSICGKILEQNNSNYCNKCFLEGKKDLEIIRNYTERNPANNILEIARKTGVPLKRINRLIMKRTQTSTL